eukprot:TRINITY_DN3209_c0_g1_i1.p1 TRINITY_DN3209_c0_g1~~TRINITY_DN3209_c0_g1_i1.p1  ORF type:complete len:450 (+),score=149.82 TRINITY_DN3209_c0_g1_i1:57-1352(+)
MSSDITVLRQLVDLRTVLEDQKLKIEQLDNKLSLATQRIQGLENELAQEREKNKQIKAWIRDNIGPNLEGVKELIKAEINSKDFGGGSEINLLSSSGKRQEVSFEYFGYSKEKESSAPGEPETKVPDKSVKSPIPRQAEIEQTLWGSTTIQVVTDKDSSLKINKPGRINYLLTTMNHAILKYSCNTLVDKVTSFMGMGGKFLPVTAEVDLKKDNFFFGITETDELYPVCTDGLTRSQIMYLVLMGIKRKLGTTRGVAIPHGALSGFDPFIKEDKSAELLNYYRFMGEEELKNMGNGKLDSSFEETFGQKRNPRFGQDQCGSNQNLTLFQVNFPSSVAKANTVKLRQTMREYFDLYYYRIKANPKVRTIFLAFGSAVPVVLDRLLEVNTAPNSLSSVYLISLPFGVKSFSEATPKLLLETYKAYSSLFLPSL